MKKGLWGFAFFMCGFIAFGGINAFFRDFSTDPGDATSNLVLGLIGVALLILCIKKRFFPKSKPKNFQKSATPPAQRPARSVASRQPAVSASEKAVIDAMESQLSRMMTESVKVETHSVDPDEDVRTPKGAEISYLDAQALKFWDDRQIDFVIPDYYSNSAFGRNVGPALQRLISGGYLRLSSIEKNIKLKTVPELKAVLADHGLKVSGTKAILTQRLIENIPLQELSELFPVGVYEITPKGEHALEAYSIIFTSKRLGVELQYYRLMNEKESHPMEDDTEIILRLLRQDLAKTDKDSYRYTATEVGRVLLHVGRTEEAMEYYCLSFFMCWYHITVDLKVEAAYPYEYDANRIDECGMLCGYSLQQTLDVFQTALRKHNPFSLCTSQNIVAAQQALKTALST